MKKTVALLLTLLLSVAALGEDASAYAQYTHPASGYTLEYPAA